MSHLVDRAREPKDTLPPWRYASGQSVAVDGVEAVVIGRSRRTWMPTPLYKLKGEGLSKMWYREDEIDRGAKVTIRREAEAC